MYLYISTLVVTAGLGRGARIMLVRLHGCRRPTGLSANTDTLRRRGRGREAPSNGVVKGAFGIGDVFNFQSRTIAQRALSEIDRN